MQPELVVGIDVHKHELVVAADDPATPVATYPNTSPGRQQVIAVLAQQPIRLVVMEASGGQERALLQDLWEAGIPVCRANARRMRDFARATGLLAKTDDLDARLLARAGRQLELTPQPMPSTEQQELADLQAYRRRLVADGVAISNRLGQATHPVIVASLQRQLASIAAERTAIEAEMNRVLAACAALQARVDILESVPGIGPRTARLLVAALPELGQATSQEIAALAGVAPMNHDSGLYRGRRRIRGGAAGSAGRAVHGGDGRHDPQSGLHRARRAPASQRQTGAGGDGGGDAEGAGAGERHVAGWHVLGTDPGRANRPTPLTSNTVAPLHSASAPFRSR